MLMEPNTRRLYVDGQIITPKTYGDYIRNLNPIRTIEYKNGKAKRLWTDGTLELVDENDNVLKEKHLELEKIRAAVEYIDSLRKKIKKDVIVEK